MKDRIVEIPTKAGRMPTFVTHPEQDGPFPPVIVFMDVWGVRGELYDIARRIGTIGYYAMVPDFYYRQGTIRQTYIDAEGKRISLAKLPREEHDKVVAKSAATPDWMIVDDVVGEQNFLAAAATHIQGGEIIECTGSGYTGKEPAVGCVPKGMFVRGRDFRLWRRGAGRRGHRSWILRGRRFLGKEPFRAARVSERTSRRCAPP